jgi:[ribosomal protein S5]-alanine N-acetyltransferase
VKINSERLKLREITNNDLKDIHWLHSFPKVDEFNTLGIPENIEVTRKILQSTFEDQKKETRREIQWSIRLSTNQTFIGLAGMRLSEERFKMGEIFYKLAPDYWGNGYATEAARALISFGFDTFGLHRIEAGTATKNIKSIHVLEKIGMKREGIRRKILPIRGKWYDNYQYAILENDSRL